MISINAITENYGWVIFFVHKVVVMSKEKLWLKVTDNPMVGYTLSTKFKKKEYLKHRQAKQSYGIVGLGLRNVKNQFYLSVEWRNQAKTVDNWKKYVKHIQAKPV